MAEDKPQKSHIEKAQTRNSLNTEDGFQMLRASFRHSQGNPELQTRIFEYFSILNPSIKIDDDLLQKIIIRSMPPTIKVVQNPKTHAMGTPMSLSDASSTLRDEAIDMQRSFEAKPLSPEDRTGIVKEITTTLIIRDYRYRNGRPHRLDSSNHITPQTDPYLSYFCYYGLEGHQTELPELDSLYEEVTKYLKDGFPSRPVIWSVNPKTRKGEYINGNKALAGVIQAYYKWHPDINMSSNSKKLLQKINHLGEQ